MSVLGFFDIPPHNPNPIWALGSYTRCGDRKDGRIHGVHFTIFQLQHCLALSKPLARARPWSGSARLAFTKPLGAAAILATGCAVTAPANRPTVLLPHA